MQRASNISKFGRSNAMGMDAFMGYNDDTPLALPTIDQAAQGQMEAANTAEAKAMRIAEQPQQQQNQAPIIIQGGAVTNITNNNTSGGSGGAGVGSPSRTPNPFDKMVFGEPWAYSP
jgi:hypothetical protein